MLAADPMGRHVIAHRWRMFATVPLSAASNSFDTITGLPVHALVVHVVIVLLPLAALGAIGIALVPRWSVRFGIVVWPLALVATGAAVVAEKSGEQLALRVGNPLTHAELGEQMKYFAAALTIVTFMLWFVDRREADRRRAGLTKILAIIVIVAAVLSVGWVYRVGDSGYRAVWAQVIQDTPLPTR